MSPLRRHIFVCFMAKSAFWMGFSLPGAKVLRSESSIIRNFHFPIDFAGHRYNSAAATAQPVMCVYFWHLRFLKILVNINQYLVQQCLLYTSSMLPILWRDMLTSLRGPDCTCYRLRALISFLVIRTYFSTFHVAMHSPIYSMYQ